MFHLFPIGIFPHFTGRLCHFWHIIQRRRRPVGKPVRQKSPLGRLIFLVLSLSLFFSQVFFLGSKIIFSEPSQTALARRIPGFSKKKFVFAQKRKKENMLKCLAAWHFSNYTQ